MRFVLIVVVLAIVGLLAASTGQTRPAAPQLTCKYGFKWVTKTVHGHKKRVKVCKAKPKPKPQADLELTTTTSAVGNQITSGNHVSYTFVIENKGPEVADGIELTVDFPASESGQTIFGGGGSGPTDCNAGATNLTCHFGALAPESDEGTDEQPSYAYIQILLEPTETGDHLVTAQVKSGLQDPHPENNSSSLPLRVLAGPPSGDLSISLTSAPDPATIRGGFTETVSVTNTGPTEATDVNATVLLPPGVVLGSFPQVIFGTLRVPTGLCPYGYGATSTTSVCFDSIASGETKTATLRFVPSLHSPPTLETAAVVSAYTADPNLANNRASSSTALAPFEPLSGPDLVVGIDPPKEPVAGEPFAFGLRLANVGLGTAHDVNVKVDSTPALSLAQLYIGQPSPFSELGCASSDPGGGTPTDCTLDELPSDGRLLGLVGAQASKPGTYTATVTVTSPDLAAPLQSLLSFTVK